MLNEDHFHYYYHFILIYPPNTDDESEWFKIFHICYRFEYKLKSIFKFPCIKKFLSFQKSEFENLSVIQFCIDGFTKLSDGK